jgi:hypothetical protein
MTKQNHFDKLPQLFIKLNLLPYKEMFHVNNNSHRLPT